MRIAIIMLSMLAISHAGEQSKKISPLPKELAGGSIPNFFVLAADNETELDRKSLKEEAKRLGAKRVVLSFFATWCVNCQKEFVLLRQSASRLKENGVLVYLIDVGEKIASHGDKVRRFAEEYAGDAFPFYFDQSGNLLKNFGIIERSQTQFNLPVIVVADADLRVLSVFTEAGDDFPQILWSEL
ncbi:MAG: TlpA family protein disulfide reductase [Fibromonadaceae bacterium]|nr:TlpA family protein disulfide reductase [Fibromonadaceae bacterium]